MNEKQKYPSIDDIWISKYGYQDIGLFQKLEVPYDNCRTMDLKILLNMVRKAQSSGLAYGSDDCWENLVDNPLSIEGKARLEQIALALKLELAKRPHMPNAKERKDIRRKKAQGKL